MSAKIRKLAAAIESDDVNTARELLKPGFLRKPAHVNERFNGLQTALMTAAKKGNLEMVRLLLDAGADVSARDFDQSTALMYADKLCIVEALVRSGADVNAKTEDDETALMFAVERGDPAVVKFLLDAGADVNLRTKDTKTVYKPSALRVKEPYEEKTALMLAIENSQETIIRMILEKKPVVDFKNNRGGTALNKALDRGDRQTVKLLMDAGLKVNWGEVIAGRLQRQSAEFQLEIVKFFLDSGADVNAGHYLGRTALMGAANINNLAVVRSLVEAGADINKQDEEGNTVLFFLAEHGALEDEAILKYLCEHGLNVNIANSSGHFPCVKRLDALYAFSSVLLQAGATYLPGDSHWLFIEAVNHNDIALAKHLLENGAETEWDIERTGEDQWGRYSSSYGFSVLAYAKEKGAAEIVQLLERHSQNPV